MWIDTHCHLDDAVFDSCRDVLVSRLRVLGVNFLIIPATRLYNFSKVALLAHRYNFAYTLGIHPWFSAELDEKWLFYMKKMIHSALRDPFFVGIGEIGLDFFRPNLDKEKQIFLFVEQLKIAKDLDLPVVCHACRSIDSVCSYIKRIGVNKGIVHAFSGSWQQAENAIRIGLKLGFGGMVRLSRAKNIQNLAKLLPVESIVLETDAPHLQPRNQKIAESELTRLEHCTPEILPVIAEIIAEKRKLFLQELAFLIKKNVFEVFPRLVHVMKV